MPRFRRLKNNEQNRIASDVVHPVSLPSIDRTDGARTGSARSVGRSSVMRKSDGRRSSMDSMTSCIPEMTKAQYDEQIARTMSEETWRNHMRTLAGSVGFDLLYHTYRSDHSDKGWPDDVMSHQLTTRMLLIEAKRQDGHLTYHQVLWLDRWARFRDSGNWGLEVYGAVRPLDRDQLWETLQGHSEQAGGLHQWCVVSGCERCQHERDIVTVMVPGRRSRRRR